MCMMHCLHGNDGHGENEGLVNGYGGRSGYACVRIGKWEWRLEWPCMREDWQTGMEVGVAMHGHAKMKEMGLMREKK